MTRSLARLAGALDPRLFYFSLVLAFTFQTAAQDVPAKKFTVRVQATINENPPTIGLSWPDEGDANAYKVSRRTLASGWQEIGQLGGGATSFSDGSVAIGTAYEYQIVKTTSSYTGYGYIRAGIRVPAVEQRGKILLLVENGPAGALGGELDRLQRDLTADGWVVVRRTASMNDSPQAVKGIIRSVYDSDRENLKALFLFGHIPVPYSGEIMPDGHDNHLGAWPADVYYGEMDGTWTDERVNTVVAEREANRNVPGDGKFDQSQIPSDVDLMVGRVDLHNMTCYANKSNARSEIDLLRQYLNKNHAFRNGNIAVERRALICDNFGDKGRDPIAGSAWRTFSGAVGDRVEEAPWDGFLGPATSGTYLWSYGSGGGTYYYSVGVASSDDFALRDVKVVFAMFMGSYFGDWNNESNYLRAALGSGYILTSSYSGFPHTLNFPMSLGETIGYCMRQSQNNGLRGLYPPWAQGTRQVHISLHGDPTLRMHPVKPVSNLSSTATSGRVSLQWRPSSDSNIQGYHVYRATNPEGPFTRVTQQPIAGISFSEPTSAGTYTYMVRAIKLESTPSGSYYNPSAGLFVTQAVPGGGTSNQPLNLTVQTLSGSQLVLRISGEAGQRFRLESSSDFRGWNELGTGEVSGASSEFQLQVNPSPGRTFLRTVNIQ